MKTITNKGEPMKSWWHEQLVQRRGSAVAFILEFVQGVVPKKKPLLTVYERLYEIFEFPSLKTQVVIDKNSSKIIETSPNIVQISEILAKVQPKYVIPIKIIDFAPFESEERPGYFLFDSEEDFESHLSDELEKEKQALQPILEICRTIAQENSNPPVTINVTLNFRIPFAKGSINPDGELFIRFFLKWPKEVNEGTAEVLIERRGDQKTISIPVKRESFYHVWYFVNSLLPGLNPLRFGFCEVCDRVIYRVNPLNKYCSRACQQKAYRLRKKQEQEKARKET